MRSGSVLNVEDDTAVEGCQTLEWGSLIILLATFPRMY